MLAYQANAFQHLNDLYLSIQEKENDIVTTCDLLSAFSFQTETVVVESAYFAEEFC